MHKFKILKAANDQFRIQFLYNAEVMVWSENYASKASAKNCIESIKKNAPGAATVDVSKDETGSGYRFEIVSKQGRRAFRPLQGVQWRDDGPLGDLRLQGKRQELHRVGEEERPGRTGRRRNRQRLMMNCRLALK